MTSRGRLATSRKENPLPQLTLFTSPRACSSACHIALEESGLPYDIHLVKIREGQHQSGEYLRINPWGKIPALRIGDEVLTEAQAIMSYIGDSSDKDLLPQRDALARARAHEWMNFLASTVHIAFRPLFKPQYLIGDAELYPKLHETGIPLLRNTLLEVDRRLAGKTWALGDSYSVVDPYLLVFWIWSQRDDVVPHVADMPNWRAQAERVLARPATWSCLNREGVTKDNISDP
jgi:glutathione S-transferase